MRFARQIFVLALVLLHACQFSVGHVVHLVQCDGSHGHVAHAHAHHSHASQSHSHSHSSTGCGTRQADRASCCSHSRVERKAQLAKSGSVSLGDESQHVPHDADSCAVCRALAQVQIPPAEFMASAGNLHSIDRFPGDRNPPIVRVSLAFYSRGPPTV